MKENHKYYLIATDKQSEVVYVYYINNTRTYSSINWINIKTINESKIITENEISLSDLKKELKSQKHNLNLFNFKIITENELIAYML